MASLPILGGIGLLIGLILLALKFAQKSSSASSIASNGTKDDKKKKKGNANNANGPPSKKVTLDPEADAKYILNHLRPNSTPLDILYTIATSPDNITVSTKSLELRADVVQRKLDHLKEEKRKADAEAASGHSNVNATLDELLNDDDDWADDDDEDSDAVKAAKAAEELKKKQEAELNKATGKTQDDVTKVMLEGVDDNVLGMEWVKENLTELGVWPPPGYNNTQHATSNPAVQRNLIMTMGRLNARQLNNHPDLLKAGPSGKIDPTYFQSTMEYRQRVGQQLEHCLRFACTIRCFQLAMTILDTIVMFKIGLMDVNDTKDREWFQELMVKQYGSGGTPKLIMEDKYLGVPTVEPTKADPNGSAEDKKEEEKNKLTQLIQQSRQVTTSDDKMSLEMQITRRHAEAFTKAKLEQCQRQGIPPQLAMQAYRESWFIIVRAYKLNGNDDESSRMMGWDGAMGGVSSNHFDILKKNNHPIFANILTSETANAFEKQIFETNKMCDNKLIVGWPFVISNVAQKTGKVKILLPTPDEAGRYEFVVTIKSQEFLGDVEEFKMVVDVAKGVEKKKDGEGEEEKEDDESKKDK